MDLQQRIDDILSIESLEVGFSAVHLESGEQVQFNQTAIFPTASVFKIPVMIEVYRQAEEGRFKLSDRLSLKEDDKTLTTGVLLALDGGLQPTIKDLVTLMIIVSDNTATTMLMELIGKNSVNTTMRLYDFETISVTMTVHEMFIHAFGLTSEAPVGLERLEEIVTERQMDYASLTFARTAENNVASADEMTRLIAGIVERRWVSRDACEQMVKILNMQQYTGRVPSCLPWESAANKTGTMRGLRNDSGIIIRGPSDHLAFSLFTFDSTPLPLNNSSTLRQRDGVVAELMGDVGKLLWEQLGRP